MSTITTDETANTVDRPIDFAHLTRQTLGDPSLEREVLNLFRVQSGILIERLAVTVDPADRLLLAHTIKGSARAIGAWNVVEAASRIEAGEGEVATVRLAVFAANRIIDERLAA